MTSFRKRLEARYQVRSDDAEAPVSDARPGEVDTQPGSAHPDNWQKDIQSGKSAEQIRQDAVALSGILQGWQNNVLQADEYYKELAANADKYLHLYNPILIKGLSRDKLETIALICSKFAKLATIV
jgi:hypothetical protein